VDKVNIVETRYYIGGYEVYRKVVNDVLDLERNSVSVYDVKAVEPSEEDKEDFVPKYAIDYNRRIVLIDTKTIEDEQTLNVPEMTVRYQYSNHLGSACLELDEIGQIISYEEFYPFGSTSYRSGRSETEVSLKRYKYNGKERDEESGLYYYGARYYAAWLCRFLSVDPLQFEKSWITPYAYCADNPIKFIDPNGMDEWEINKSGKINRVEGSEGKPDKMFVVDNDGKRVTDKKGNEKSVTVDKEIMNSLQTGKIETTEIKIDFSTLDVTGKEGIAQNMFKFLSNNTEVLPICQTAKRPC
jgi:RHS repeat-associated protein